MDYGHKWTDDELKALEARIAAEYRQATNEIKKKLDDYLEKFKVEDAKKRQEVKDGLISQKEYADWRKRKLMTGKRWQEMLNGLAHDLQTVNRKTASMTRQFSFDAYAMNYNYGTYEAEIGSGVNISRSFTLYNREAVERLVRDDPDMLPPPGKAVSEAIAAGKAELWNKRRIQSVMTQSILQGESIPNIAKRLAEEVGDSNYKAAVRNARTMTTGAENAGRVDSYKRAESMGIDMQQMWIATLDNRTRHEHRQLDRQKVKPGEDFHYGIYKLRFPGDPHGAPFLVYNCRCGVIGIVDGMGLEERLDKMEKEGLTKEGLTYNEWKKGKAKAEPETVNENWADEIRQIQNKDPKTEADIIQAGKILANEIQPMKDEYINSVSALNQQRNEAYNIYNETTKQLSNLTNAKSPIRESLSDLSGNLLSKNYSDLPLFKKMALQKHLDRFKIDLDIKDTDKPEDILKKLDSLLNDTTNKRSKAIKDFNDAMKGLDGKWIDYATKLKAKLSEIRPMGIGSISLKSHLSGNKEMKQVISQAYDFYPTDWIANSVNRGGLKAKKVKRGFYDDYDGVIAISGDADSYSLATAIHELGHRYERSQDLKQYETEFYDRRTAGESLQWLGKSGGNYRRDEMSRFDNFVSPYMGKDYHGTSYELCSMGFEYAYSKPEELAKDPDMESWILGMLAVC